MVMDNTAKQAVGESPDAEGGLSRRDRDILAFERQWWQYAGLKEQAIKDMFGLSATRYYQVLNEIIDNPAALAAAIGAAAKHHDLVLTSGGVSTGEADHVRDAVEQIGKLWSGNLLRVMADVDRIAKEIHAAKR